MLSVNHLDGFGCHSDEGCSCTPAYVTGDRSASITISSAAGINSGVVGAAIDGVTTSATGFFFTGSQAVSGLEMLKFQWAARVKINEVKLYLGNNTGSNGLWKFQGSDDGSSWTDIGTSINPIGVQTLTDNTMSANATGYFYYRYVGISGTTAGASRTSVDEVEFQQCSC